MEYGRFIEVWPSFALDDVLNLTVAQFNALTARAKERVNELKRSGN